MRFWLVELAGWLLLGFGLYFFCACYDLVEQNRVVGTAPIMAIGFIIFRGGIQLIKVAVAGRVCSRIPGTLPEDKAASASNAASRKRQVSSSGSRLL
jgi:hypothetical protein